MTEQAAYFAPPGGIEVGQIGNPLASDTIMYPTHRVHHVTGTAEIDSISTRYLWDDFVGPLILIADGAWTWTTDGNIALAGEAIAGGVVPLWFDRQLGKWYPVCFGGPFPEPA